MNTVFHTATGWNGVPPDPQKSGWHVLGMRQFARSATTGAMVFLSHWCAQTRCWGTDPDRRPPSWAASQGLSWISHAPDVPSTVRLEFRKAL
ncbi:hypothetical protein [Gluconobacter albidus]|nr:hypothetical protein [Gluconobacter albidus]MBS1029431.1 hypothetical protein [Gluconobacter albidus]